MQNLYDSILSHLEQKHFKVMVDSGKRGNVNFDDDDFLKTKSQKVHKERPVSPDHLGAIWWRDIQQEQKNIGRRYGFERLAHIYSAGVPAKFEELQGRHPHEFIDEIKEHHKEPPRPYEESHQVHIEDMTAFATTEWMEPLRKGQHYFDYCRDKWMSKTSQLGAALGPVSTMYSLWSVSKNAIENGGVAGIIAYMVITVFFIIPLIYAELAIGQFHRFGVVKTMKQACPLMYGLGYLMLLLTVGDYLLSVTRTVRLLFYTLSSVRHEFPWKNCHKAWTWCKQTLSYDDNVTYGEGEVTPAVEFFRSNVIRNFKNKASAEESGWDLSNLPNPLIVLCFFTGLGIVHYVSKRNCQHLGRRMYFIFGFASIFMLFSYLLRVFTTPWTYYIMTLNTSWDWGLSSANFARILDPKVWVAVFRQAITSSGVGTGIYITFGSHNTFVNHEIKVNAVISGVANFLVHLFVGITLIHCHSALKITNSFLNATTAYGTDTIFEIFPQVVQQHQPSRGYTWMLFVVVVVSLLFFSMNRIYSCLFTIQQYFSDKNKLYYEPTRADFNYWERHRVFRQARRTLHITTMHRKSALMATVILVLALPQLLTFFPGGEFYLNVAELMWYKYLPPFVVLLECIVIFFFLGVRTLNSYIRKMTTWQVTLWYRFVWKSITPVFPLLYFVHFKPWLDPINSDGRVYNDHYSCIICCGIPLVFILVTMVKSVISAPCASFINSIQLLSLSEHEHAEALKGVKPLTRFHWMHHLSVPNGIARGICAKSNNPRIPAVRFHYPWLDKFLWSLIWNVLGFSALNEVPGCQESSLKSSGGKNRANTVMFPAEPIPTKPKKKVQAPDLVPNMQIENVLKMRKRSSLEYRRKWFEEGDKKKAPAYLPTEKEKRKKTVDAPIAADSTKKINVAEMMMSAVEEDFLKEGNLEKEDLSSESEVGEMAEFRMPPYEESFDDIESNDWEDFSDASVYSEGSAEDPEKVRQAKNFAGRRNPFGSSENEGMIELEERKYFRDFLVDEFEEFEDIMDPTEDRPAVNIMTQKQPQETSETDTDEPSDSGGSIKIEEPIENIVRSDEDFDSLEEFVTVTHHHHEHMDDDADGSCNNSSCSDDSSWSSRPSSAPSLDEGPSLVVASKGAKGPKRKRKTKKHDKDAYKRALDPMRHVEGPFSILGGVRSAVHEEETGYHTGLAKALHQALSEELAKK